MSNMMLKSNELEKRNKLQGFTLIEVMVALMIVASVLTSTFTAISSFADQRQRVHERFLGQSIAWNQLMERYSLNNVWRNELSGELEDNGVATLYGSDWHWQIKETPALGRGVFKQTAEVYLSGSFGNSNQVPSASLVIFETRSVAAAQELGLTQ